MNTVLIKINCRPISFLSAFKKYKNNVVCGCQYGFMNKVKNIYVDAWFYVSKSIMAVFQLISVIIYT